MWIVISTVIITLMTIAGITGLLQQLWLFLMRPKGDPPRMLVVFLKNDICVQQLRAAMEQLRWDGNSEVGVIAAVDCGIDEASKEICERIANEQHNVIFGTAELLRCLEEYGCVK